MKNSENTQYFFLGGLFTAGKKETILSNSKGPVQNAADSLQRKLIIGLDSVLEDGISLINFPFIGSFPSFFRRPYFSGEVDSLGRNSRILGYGFCNIVFIRLISRFINACYALLLIPRDKKVVLIVYSAHLPFILASVIFRALRKGALTCLVLPDLPEFMGDFGIFRKFLKYFDVKLFYFLVRYFDGYVLLTSAMADRLNLRNNKYVVIEGVSNLCNVVPTCQEKLNKKVFLYTGTLAKRYGILNLVRAFSLVKNDSVELWICGDGDAKLEIVEFSKADSRIKYLGQVDSEVALSLQQKASVLVNPRTPEGDYTKYSFPSKILEYMSSGKPVMMYKMEGIPSEYDEYYISPRGLGVDMLAECLENILKMDDEALSLLGKKAQAFVAQHKNPVVQAEKIINLLQKEIQ